MCMVPLVFTRVLFKILTNGCCQIGKDSFLQRHNGIIKLKTYLNSFRANPGSYESYLYCLGMIPSLLTLNQNYNEDFIDAGYISLLAR